METKRTSRKECPNCYRGIMVAATVFQCVMVRFATAARCIYASLKQYTNERQTQYEVLRQSQQIKERAPLTIVSMTFKIALACENLAQDKGTDWNEGGMTAGQKEKVLQEVFNEFNHEDINAVHDAYRLNYHQMTSVQHLLLHTCPAALKEMQALFDDVPERKTPFRHLVLETKRWIIGGCSKKCVGTAKDVWITMMHMDDKKQLLFMQMVCHEAGDYAFLLYGHELV